MYMTGAVLNIRKDVQDKILNPSNDVLWNPSKTDKKYEGKRFPVDF